MIDNPYTREIYDKIGALSSINTVFEIGCDALVETTPRLRAMFPTARIFSFDPCPENTAAIQSSQADVNLNVTFVNKAVADTKGPRHFWVSTNNGLSSSLKTPKVVGHRPGNAVNWNDSITVECTTLDAFCIENAIDSIDLIHMDVQSGEDLILKGAIQMLPRTRYIFTEHNTSGDYLDEPTYDGILALLPGWKSLGIWAYDALFENINV